VLEIVAYARGASVAILGNVVARILVCLLFAVLSRRVGSTPTARPLDLPTSA